MSSTTFNIAIFVYLSLNNCILVKFIFYSLIFIFLVGCNTPEKSNDSFDDVRMEVKDFTKPKLDGIWRLDSIVGTDELLFDLLFFIPGDSMIRINTVHDSMVIANFTWDTTSVVSGNIEYPISYVDSNKILISINDVDHYFMKREEFSREELNSKKKCVQMYNFLFGKWVLDSADASPISLTFNCPNIMLESVLDFTPKQEIRVVKAEQSEMRCWNPNYSLSYDFESNVFLIRISAGCGGDVGTIKVKNRNEIYMEGLTERAEIIKLQRLD